MLQQRRQQPINGRLHILKRLRRVKNAIALRRCAGTTQIGSAYRLEKALLFLLETVEPATGRCTGKSDVDRQIKHQRQIGAQIALDETLELGDACGGQAAPTALIGVGRIGKKVTEHPLATRECRLDDLLEMLRPRRENQQQLGIRGHRLVTWAQQQFANAFGQRCATGLAGQAYRHTLLTQTLRKVLAVGALAGAFRSFQGDEHALLPLLHRPAGAGLER